MISASSIDLGDSMCPDNNLLTTIYNYMPSASSILKVPSILMTSIINPLIKLKISSNPELDYKLKLLNDETQTEYHNLIGTYFYNNIIANPSRDLECMIILDDDLKIVPIDRHDQKIAKVLTNTFTTTTLSMCSFTSNPYIMNRVYELYKDDSNERKIIFKAGILNLCLAHSTTVQNQLKEFMIKHEI
jgi:hypothetical protein